MAKASKVVAKPVAKAAKGAQKAEVKASKKKAPVKEVRYFTVSLRMTHAYMLIKRMGHAALPPPRRRQPLSGGRHLRPIGGSPTAAMTLAMFTVVTFECLNVLASTSSDVAGVFQRGGVFRRGRGAAAGRRCKGQEGIYQ